MRIRRGIGAGVAGAMVAAGALVALPAHAGSVQAADLGGVKYGAPGAADFTVPAGICTVHATVAGGAGGDGSPDYGLVPGKGGAGAIVTATLPVEPGEQLVVLVAARGATGTGNSVGDQLGEGGAGGSGEYPGGKGGDGYSPNFGAAGAGGGGGLSYVGDNFSYLVLAGGGGGGGAAMGQGTAGDGGDAGAAGGAGADGAPGPGATGGQGGSSGGNGGTGGAAGSAGTVAGADSAGLGPGAAGGGSDGQIQIMTAGGGGGAGFVGGGGGGSTVIAGGGGGGAGSSAIGGSATDATFATGNHGDGYVTIEWDPVTDACDPEVPVEPADPGVPEVVTPVTQPLVVEQPTEVAAAVAAEPGFTG